MEKGTKRHSQECTVAPQLEQRTLLEIEQTLLCTTNSCDAAKPHSHVPGTSQGETLLAGQTHFAKHAGSQPSDGLQVTLQLARIWV